MRLVKLERVNRKPVYVNPDAVKIICDLGEKGEKELNTIEINFIGQPDHESAWVAGPVEDVLYKLRHSFV